MRKLLCLFVVILVISQSLVFATDEMIAIKDISIKNKVVSVSVENEKETKTVITMLLVKEDESLTQEERVYHFLQKNVDAGEDVIYRVEIPDLRYGNIPGSGEYTVSIREGASHCVAETFYYADSTEIDSFITILKNENAKIGEDALPYIYLLPVFEDANNKGTLFSLGIKYDEFMAESVEFRQELMSTLHKNNLEELSYDDLIACMSEFYGLTQYNIGHKEKAAEFFDFKYSDEQANNDFVKITLDNMGAYYETLPSFKDSFVQLYGIVTVASASVNEMESVLDKFCLVTGECSQIIKKIKSLNVVKKYRAYEIVEAYCDKKMPTTVSELREIFEVAYDSATETSGNSGSSGGGGGSSGGGGGGSVSNTDSKGSFEFTSSLTNETKVEVSKLFADVTEEHWAAESVEYLKRKGIVSGNGEGKFLPEQAITREEFTKMIVLSWGLKSPDNETTFEDAINGAWYVPYISAAADNKIVSGIGDNKFGIGLNITRQDMAVMVLRAMKTTGNNHKKIRNYTAFEDEWMIAGYAKDAITELFEAGIINGKGVNVFDPSGTATRAEAAKIIYEALKGE